MSMRCGRSPILAVATVVLASVVAVGSGAGATSAAATAAPRTWQYQEILPVTTEAVATAGNGDLYELGQNDYRTTNDLYQRDAPGHWTRRASVPDGDHTRATMVNGADGRLYLLGGEYDCGPCYPERDFTGNVLAYSPATDAWTSLAASPDNFADDVGAAGAPDGTIYEMGGGYSINSGGGSQSTNASAQAYTPATNTWTSLPNMPTSRGALAVAVGQGGNVFAIGGYTYPPPDPAHASATPTDVVERYSISSRTWSEVAPLPVARSGIQATVGVDGKIYVTGHDSSRVDVYDVTTNTWSAGPAFPYSDYLVRASALTPDGSLLAVLTSDDLMSLPPASDLPTGTVTINGGNATTTNATVSVGVPSSSSPVRVRVSNAENLVSGILAEATVFPYQSPLSWNLTSTTTGGTNTPGTHTVYAQWEDASGRWSPVQQASINLGSAPAAPTAITAVAGNGSATVSWTAPSVNGGFPVTAYTVTATPGGNTTTISGTPVPTTATVAGLTNGTGYTFAVTATNAAGASSASASSHPVTPTAPTTAFSETALSFGGWAPGVSNTASGGRFRSTTIPGNTVQYRFSGSSVSWLTAGGPSAGQASITIDGISKGTQDLYRAQTGPVAISYSTPGATAHTIVIKTLGTKNTHSTGTTIRVDGFTVGGLTQQEDATNITYSGWAGGLNSSATNGSYRATNASAAVSTYSFTGSAISIVTATGPSYGQFAISIDGASKGTLSQYAPAQQWQTLRTFTGLPAGNHAITVTVLGKHDASSTGSTVVLDGVRVTS